jgi:phage major head subunit gpT-like protein
MATRGNFGDLLEPGLRKIFDDVYKELPEQFSKIFKINTSTKQDETDSAVTGFGLMEEHSENEPLKYEEVLQGDQITYTHKTFRKGFTVSEELYEDDQYNVIKKKPAALARSARRTVEYYASAVLNNAFSTSYVGGDGKPLCSTLHTLAESSTGVVQSNAQANGAVLSEAAIKAGILAMRGQLDDKGMKIMVRPSILVVPPALEHTAKIILQSTLRSGEGSTTSFNDANTLKGELEIFVYDWITSTTAWFLIDKDVAELNYFWRAKPSFAQDESFDTDAARYKARMRFSCGFSDWRGVYGSKGDGQAYAS